MNPTGKIHFQQIASIVFALYCLIYLIVFAFPNIWLVDKYALFIFTWEHFSSFLIEPAGVLRAITGIVSDLFYYPGLGVVILTLLLITIQKLIKYSTGLSGYFLPLTYFPAVILLALQSVIGNHLFFIFGIITSLSMVALQKYFARIRYGWRLNIGVFIFFYFVSGSYALLGILLITMRSIFRKDYTKLYPIFLLMVCGVLIPCLSAIFVYNTSPFSSSFTGGLPPGFFSGNGQILNMMRGVIAVIIACYAFLPFSHGHHDNTRSKRMMLYYSMTVIICSVLLIGFTQKQKQQLLVVEMTRYLYEERWNDILILAGKQDRLSRAETVMVNLALCKTGKLPDSLMDYPQNYASKGMYLDLDKSVLAPIIGSKLYHHLGFSNYANRWAMEGVAMGIFSPVHLKTLLMESLVRGEYSLTRKYLYYFSHSLFYKRYASAVEDYLNGTRNEELKKEVEKQRANLPATNSVTDEFFDFNYRLYRYVSDHQENRETCDYTLCSCLLNKEIIQFAQLFELCYPPGKKNPVLYAQALVIYQVMMESKGVFNHRYPLSPELLRQFNMFNATFRVMDSKEQAIKEMSAEFGKTYWYYYVLTEVKK